jgi:hypothetical protein
MANVLQKPINSDDGGCAARIIQEALSIAFERVFDGFAPPTRDEAPAHRDELADHPLARPGPYVALLPITHIAAILTTIAMAALGLGADIRVVAKSGVRVTLAVTASLIVLGFICYALIRVAGIP